MENAFELEHLTKRFGSVTALDDVTLSVPRGSIVGLVGKNGSGKTTLIRTLTGLYVPTGGTCVTLGRASDQLGPDELGRIGVVHQRGAFLYWMKVGQHIRYVSSFYRTWDCALERNLLDQLELDVNARVGTLSPGDLQKLAIITAVCHHPDLLLLDEPVSALDPIARERMLTFLLELLQQDGNTILVSSHVLRDVERIVNWVVCLNRGRVTANESLDTLQERYAEWVVTSTDGKLPADFTEDFVLTRQGNAHQAKIVVADAAHEFEAFLERYSAQGSVRPLNLERMFPLLLGEANVSDLSLSPFSAAEGPNDHP